jgi:hypothetical protein
VASELGMQDRILGAGGWARGRAWRVAVPALLLWGMLTAGTAPGGIDEYRVKAAFLYNFCKFVSWPERDESGAEQPFVIGVVGDPLKAAVFARELEGKRIGER